ncbi:hypothetical protein LTR78_009877 [Recurvomyces mirabilis]|uniref:Arrestin C-terminal-like domain-containing protein n=1 Tax=Recurvomyces mirabilis TaxID=574656 RepID=A0AAE0WH67_9PEZI|nr:hypothetical protein LTR78_009877 [Recurvomyces mirabilis]KAK5150552.1 hypothetical protein LTS14_010046 [Recurvomyces mirabilis]
MAGRVRAYEISRPKPLPEALPLVQPATAPPPNPTKSTRQPTPAAAASVWPPPLSRPLSDIREITEPSLMDMVSRYSNAPTRRREQNAHKISPEIRHHFAKDRGVVKHKGSVERKSSVRRSLSGRSKDTARSQDERYGNPYEVVASSSYSSTPEKSSCYAIPQSSVPHRSSSFGRSEPPSRAPSRRNTSIRVPWSKEQPQFSVSNRGPCRSPVKEAVRRSDPVSADSARRVPSRTLIRRPHPVDILNAAECKHPRVVLDLRTTAPVFVGGGSLEGLVTVIIDHNERAKERRTLGVGSVTVDLLGYEQTSGDRKATFLALGSDVIDANHPPPASMVEPSNPLTPGDKFWTLCPSSSTLPFMLSLPLDTGPPPFQSRHASIRYVLCATALIRDAGTHYRVRVSKEVQILPTYDPEKALASLPTPLTASDELLLRKTGGHERIRVTAGLHRQIWVSGSTIFVDVHVANKSGKAVRKLQLSLERDVLCYKHAAADTKALSVSQARVFESNHQSTIATNSLKAGANEWNGVPPHSSEIRTYDLAIARDHATIRCGKYFEVRFFLNITAFISSSKSVSLQLPIILIHMNSIDVVPNSVAQVAAAIEERRAQQRKHEREHSQESRLHGRSKHVRQRSVSSPAESTALRSKTSYRPGQAFAAPHQHSLEQQRAERDDLNTLRHMLDSSPRKYMPQIQHAFTVQKQGSNISISSLGGSGERNGLPYAGSTFPTPPVVKYGRRKETRSNVTATAAAEGVDSIRQRMRRMASIDTYTSSSKRATDARSAFGPWHENTKPSPHIRERADTSSHSTAQTLKPYTLGLPLQPNPTRSASPATPPPPAFEEAGTKHKPRISRPATAIGTRTRVEMEEPQDFRSRRERTRFEFKPVRRKGSTSSSLRGRGLGLWDSVRRKTSWDTGGWI